MQAISTTGAFSEPQITHARVEALFVSELGMSSEQFARELEVELEQATPDERDEFESLVDQANQAIPKIGATLDRVAETLARMSITVGEMSGVLVGMDARVAVIEDSLGEVLPQSRYKEGIQ